MRGITPTHTTLRVGKRWLRCECGAGDIFGIRIRPAPIAATLGDEDPYELLESERPTPEPFCEACWRKAFWREDRE